MNHTHFNFFTKNIIIYENWDQNLENEYNLEIQKLNQENQNKLEEYRQHVLQTEQNTEVFNKLFKKLLEEI